MKIIIECTPNEGGTLVELLTKILRECPYCEEIEDDVEQAATEEEEDWDGPHYVDILSDDEIDITRCGESCPPAPETVVEELDRGMTE